jgi:hypothetical protein
MKRSSIGSPFTEHVYPDGLGGSQISIDATLKFPNPPISLPGRDLMRNAKKIWEELKLPELTPRCSVRLRAGVLAHSWQGEKAEVPLLIVVEIAQTLVG